MWYPVEMKMREQLALPTLEASLGRKLRKTSLSVNFLCFLKTAVLNLIQNSVMFAVFHKLWPRISWKIIILGSPFLQKFKLVSRSFTFEHFCSQLWIFTPKGLYQHLS